MGNYSSNLLDQIGQFLRVEKGEVQKKQLRRRFTEIFIRKSQHVDDLWYSFFSSHDLRIEEGTWVEIRSEAHSQFGALWYSEKEKLFYLITETPIPVSDVQIREADEYQLILMQEAAFNLVSEGKTPHSTLLKRLICNELSFSSRQQKLLNFLDEHLNESQKKAVRYCVDLAAEDLFELIHGPPGTGKTTVITEIVRQLRRRGCKVLITSHTNVAVDNVMEKLFSDFTPLELGSVIVRLGSKTKVTEKLKTLVPVRSDEVIKLKTAQVVGATLSKVSMLIAFGKLTWQDPFFDYVIVDESSMATIPLTLVGVLCGRKFILVGDHMQLPPITSRAAKRLLEGKYESLFRLLIENYRSKHTLLEVQYRSNPAIVEFSSRYFYGGRIKSDVTCKNKTLKLSCDVRNECVPGTIDCQPLICVDTSKISPYSPIGRVQFSSSQYESASYFNEYEAAVSLGIRDDLLRAGVDWKEICIITPFRAQRQILRNAIRKQRERNKTGDKETLIDHLTASTVDSFQGKERDVVIYCTTWVPDYDGQPLHITLRDFRRLNVALTRARKKLVIVGAISELNYNPYSALGMFLTEKNKLIKASRIEKSNSYLRLVEECYAERFPDKEETPEELRKNAASKPLLPSTPLLSHYEEKLTQRTSSYPLPPKMGALDFEYQIRFYLSSRPGASDVLISNHTGIPLEKVRQIRRSIEGQSALRESEQKAENINSVQNSEAEMRDREHQMSRTYTQRSEGVVVLEKKDGKDEEDEKLVAKKRRSGLGGTDRAGTW
jgi:hypothetical protein